MVRNFSLPTNWIWISVGFAFKLPWCRPFDVMWLLLSSARRYIIPIMFFHLFLFALSFRNNLHSQMTKIVGPRSGIPVLSNCKFFRLHSLQLTAELTNSGYGKIIRYDRACGILQRWNVFDQYAVPLCAEITRNLRAQEWLDKFGSHRISRLNQSSLQGCAKVELDWIKYAIWVSVPCQLFKLH